MAFFQMVSNPGEGTIHVLDFYEDIILSDIVNVLNDCIYEFNEDFETLRKVYNVKSSFEILVGTTGNSFIKFKYEI